MGSELTRSQYHLSVPEFTPDQHVEYGHLGIAIVEQRTELKRLMFQEREADYALDHADEIIGMRYAHARQKRMAEHRVEIARLDAAYAGAEADKAEHEARLAAARRRMQGPPRRRSDDEDDDDDEGRNSRHSSVDDQLRRLRSRS